MPLARRPRVIPTALKHTHVHTLNRVKLSLTLLRKNNVTMKETTSRFVTKKMELNVTYILLITPIFKCHDCVILYAFVRNDHEFVIPWLTSSVTNSPTLHPPARRGRGVEISSQVGIADYQELAKGQMLGGADGFLKLIFHTETLKLLGVHCIGDGATEIIHIGQASFCVSRQEKTRASYVHLRRTKNPMYDTGVAVYFLRQNISD